MPSLTIHLRQEQTDYLAEIEREHGLDNPSQAIKRVVDDHREASDV